MKKYSIYILIPVLAILSSCSSGDDSSTWDDYAEWREANISWLDDHETLTDNNGDPVYTKVVPAWNTNAYILMKWYNDTMKTKDNLRPLYTSTVDVKYIGRLYNNVAFDSSFTSTEPADSLYRTSVSNTINGWIIAMERMHVGDSVEILVPYEQGYGANSQGNYIKPYSALKFDIKLVDVAGEYIRP